ncbi:MAG: hypothetical protein MUC69_11355 [Gemmatimonadales bacterium]|nr:hypothetical protein [Gemmatimonadales bacterium]
MNYPHLHLMLNHVPVLGAFFSLALLAWALLRGSRELLRVALVVTLVSGVSAWPAYLTGDEAHEQVEEFPGFDHDLTHEHEDAADFGLAAMLITAGAAGVALWLGRGGREVPRWSRRAVLLIQLWSAATMARTAWLGGGIRHDEARGALTSPPVAPTGATGGGGEHEDDGHSH